MKQIQELKLEVFLHLPYSPDLAASGFHLFWPIKDYVCGHHCRWAEEVKEVRDWLAQQLKDNLSWWIHAFLECWGTCIEDGGDNTEDECQCTASIYAINCFIWLIWFLFEGPSYKPVACCKYVAMLNKCLETQNCKCILIVVLRNGENISAKQVGWVWFQSEGSTRDNRQSTEFGFLSTSQWK
jgi:hypothetical protein